MPDRKLARRPTLWRLILFNLLGGVLALLGDAPGRRSSGRPTEPIWPKPIEPDVRKDQRPALTDAGQRRSRRRFATSLAFATLFFAGAAFSAGAGDVVVDLLESDEPAVEEAASDVPTTTEESAEGEESVADTEEAPAEGEAESDEEPVGSETESEESTEPNSDEEQGAGANGEAEEETPPASEDGEASEEPPAEEPGEIESTEVPDGTDSEAPVDGGESEDSGETIEEPERATAAETPANEGREGTAEPTAPADSGTAQVTPESEETSAVEGSVDGSDEVVKEAETAEKDEPAEDDVPPLVQPTTKPNDAEELAPEIESIYATATVWLHRELPDPTPPARRLK